MATPKSDDEDDSDPVYLKLTGLPAGTTAETIEGYLSGHSAIADDDLNVEDVTILGSGVATVKVSGIEDIKSFLQQKHKIKKQPIEISVYELPSQDKILCSQQSETSTSQPHGIIPDTIEVTGENVNNTDFLEIYFQADGSGGNREKNVEWVRYITEGVVHVKFALAEDAAAVVAQEKHFVRKKSICVRYVPAPQYQYHEDKLLIMDIPQVVDCEMLAFFIEEHLKQEYETDFILDFRSDCALLVFTKKYTDEELTAMINKLISKKVKKSQLIVERCEVNCSIYVSNITNKAFTTVDALEMYFDNSRSGAGEGTIESVEMLTKDKAKVIFKDPSVILRVLEKKHERLGPNVSITECTVLDSLELTNESGTDEEDEAKEKEEVADKLKKKSKEPQAKTKEKVVEEDEKAEDIPKKKTRKKGKKQKTQEVEETETSTTPEQEKPPVPQTPLQPVILPLDPLLAKYLRFKPNMTEDIAKESLVSISIDDSRGIITITPTSSSPIDWSTKSEEMIKDVFSSTLSKVDITIPPETANTIYPMIMKFCNEGGLQYAFGQGGNKLSIGGDIGSVTKLQNDVQELCSRLIKKEEVITLNPEDYCFLKELMFPLIQKQHSSITFHCNDQHLTLSMNGSIKDVGEFQDKINHYLVHAKAPVNLQPLAVKFLQEGAGRQVLQNMTKGSNVVPYFASKENQTCLLLLSRNEHAFLVETVAARIQQEVCVKTVDLPQSFNSRVAESPKYTAFQDGLSKKHPFLATVHRNQLIIASTSTSIGEVSQSFKSFITEECSVTKDIRLKRGVWRLFHATSMEKKWTDLVSVMRENGVSIVSSSKPTAQKPFLQIKGEIINVEHAAEKIQELQCAVKERKMQISRPGICQYFYNNPNGQMVIKGIENEAQVSLEMGVDDDEVDNVSKPSQGTSQFTRICFGTTSGLKTITIFVGDITKFNRAEVIVNAANEDLKHIGGVALAIAEKGGPIIQQESDEYVQFKGKVSTGSAVLFNRVGNLPYKAIVHAVGPRWTYSRNHEREIALLKKAIRTSLSKARDYNSIALPAISSGIYGFPSDVCANALVEAAVEFSKSDPDSNISEINFVVLKDNADVFLAAAKKHMENVLTLQELPTAASVTTPTSSQRDNPLSQCRRRRNIKRTTLVSPQYSSKMNNNTYEYIKISKDSILQSKEEVVVNSTDENFGFNGMVAQQLAKAAGPGLAEECQAFPKPIPVGGVVTTGAYNLSSKHVVHVVLPEYDGPLGNSEKIFREVVQKCLAECTRLGVKSVAIPSIGAGKLKYPDNVVSKILLEEAALYMKQNSEKTSLQLVHFVLFDQHVYDVFQKIHQANSTGSRIGLSYDRQSTSIRSKTQTKPQHHSTQTFLEEISVDLRSHTYTLPHGLHLQVVQGDISSDDSDVIVNTTDKDLTLRGSGVAGALLRKGGRELQMACNTAVLQGKVVEGKVVRTLGTGSLKCKEIFHIVFESVEENTVFIKTISNCLETAEEQNFASIAFPAIGTGIRGYPVDEAVKGILVALKKFTKMKPKNIKTIRFVLLEPDVYHQFIEALNSSKESSGGLLGYIKGIGSAIGSAIFSSSNEQEHENDDVDLFIVDSKVIIYMYGETEQSVRTAENNLRTIIGGQFIKDEITDKRITALSGSEVRKLKCFAKMHNVHIEIDQDQALHSVKLDGHRENVSLVKTEVRDAMSALTQEESKKVAADVVYKTIRWIRMLSTEEEEEYGEDLNFEIEQAYQKKDRVFKCEEDDFSIDFTKMEEKDTMTDKVVKVKRMDLSQEDKPKDWDPMPTDFNGKEKHVHLVTLTVGSHEYSNVERQFNKTMAKGLNYKQIVSIQRIQNPVLYQQYKVKLREMVKHNPPGHQNEQWLFHGTSPDALDKINTQGFNRSFAGKNATAFGKGVYFARDSSYSHRFTSPDKNRYRYMYLVHVLTGEYTVGKSSMIVPPPKNFQLDQSVLFDSTVDNVANPSIFVVYNDAQNYPAYIIKYLD